MIERCRELIVVLFVGIIAANSMLAGERRSVAVNPGLPWPAADALGRALPDAGQVGPVRPDRFVGIFYFLWIGRHGRNDIGPFDVSKIMAEHPDALQQPTSPPWGPYGHYHFWGEPLYGYYRSEDPWVIRRHAALLGDAGIDTLIFDATNAVTYENVYRKVCEVFTQIRAEGGRTPHISFMLNTRAGDTARKIYEGLYKPGLFKDLWFYWKGKPLMLCDPDQADDQVRRFFTLRKAHWPFTQVNTKNAWHWEAVYPQVYGYTDDPNIPEQVNVSVAQNLAQDDGRVMPMSTGKARGRSFHDGALDTTAGAVNWGRNFQEQWNRALILAPPFVMVTGWNEWVAGRWKADGMPVMFVDQFDQEFSRDIEPAKGHHADNYYWQLVANVRRYKGAPALPDAGEQKVIRINAGFDQWHNVSPEYHDHAGETIPRDHPGVGNTHYKNATGRNDLLVMKVARDNEFVYFYARCSHPITSCNDSNWMILLIDSDQDVATGWEGFDYVLNRSVAGSAKTVLEKCRGGWSWAEAGEVSYRVSGNELHLAVPRAAIGMAPGNGHIRLDFKWIDNWRNPGDVMDFYLSGDVAPEARFKYRYNPGFPK
ncbi:MAG: hypothetical protein ISS79_10775 [Phycisphaerae bacterium]|nr:hypothetical protein [Phycisphaerae bacterium]